MQQNDRKGGKGIGTVGRRRVLGLLGGGAAITLAGELRAQENSGFANPLATPPSCIVRPQQTEGPYYIDGALQRADIRLDPSDGSQREGLPLRLLLRLTEINGTTCRPLVGALVDVWQNDALGEYSDVRDRLYDNRGKRFLRGYQLSDENGLVTFQTIYPGWYPGRTVHIHFKVRIDPDASSGREFTSQLYFDDALTDEVHQLEPYASKGQRSTRNSNDRIFSQGGSELLLSLSREGEEGEFVGVFELGFRA